MSFCCGCSWQKGTKLIAWIKILASAYLCWVSIKMLVDAWRSECECYTEACVEAVWTFLAVGIIYGILSLLLLRGACKKDVRLLSVWITIDEMLMVMAFIVVVNLLGFKVGITGLVITSYFILVVQEFIKELENVTVSQSKV